MRKITVLSGGIGGARFLQGLLHLLPDADAERVSAAGLPARAVPLMMTDLDATAAMARAALDLAAAAPARG